MPLAMATPGGELRLTAIRGGHCIRRRLADLGLNVGTLLHVVQYSGHGAVIIAVKGTRMAIGRGMAHHILVEPVI